MPTLAPASVDLVLCDLPYGVTARNEWDEVIPCAELWGAYNRVARAAVVLTAIQPFTAKLVMSNLRAFKYQWVWEKNTPTGALNAKHQPMRNHEDILVFYKDRPVYNPQPTRSLITDRPLGRANGRYTAKEATSTNYGACKTFEGEAFLKEFVNPRTVLKVASEPRQNGRLHPTQKPVALMEYLIRTALRVVGEGRVSISHERRRRPTLGQIFVSAKWKVTKLGAEDGPTT